MEWIRYDYHITWQDPTLLWKGQPTHRCLKFQKSQSNKRQDSTPTPDPFSHWRHPQSQFCSCKSSLLLLRLLLRLQLQIQSQHPLVSTFRMTLYIEKTSLITWLLHRSRCTRSECHIGSASKVTTDQVSAHLGCTCCHRGEARWSWGPLRSLQARWPWRSLCSL